MKPAGNGEKIVSIAAARNGVYAYWANDHPGPSMTQIEVWALTEDGRIFGVVLMDEMSGEMRDAESSSDFIGYGDEDAPLDDKEIRARTQIIRELQKEQHSPLT